MSQLSRLLSMGSRATSIRSLLAIPTRAAVIPQWPLRFYARAAVEASQDPLHGGFYSTDRGTSPLQRHLTELNDQVQRSGRVALRTVQSAIACGESRGFLKSVETQLLLRATGGFLKELPGAERDKLVEKIWKLTSAKELDISHYNTLLYVKLENGVQFDPSEFLKKLSDAGITPNRVTYQRLAQRYCEMGDIQNATKIIEFMKNQNLAISERIFHSLITGNLRAGNAEGARNILTIMTSANVKPTPETHTILATGLIETGDIAGGLEVISGQPLLDEQILRVAKALAVKDDLQNLEQVLKMLQNSTINFSNINNACLELIVAEKLDAAILMYKETRAYGLKRTFPSFFLIQIARSGYPVSEVFRASNALKEDIPEPVFLEIARHGIYSGKKSQALEYMEKMKEYGHPIRAHYFLPFLCAAPDEAAVLSELKEMTSGGILPSFEILSDFVFPRADSSDSLSLHKRLLDSGVPPKTATLALANFLIRNARLEDCEKLLRENAPAREGLVAFALRTVGEEKDIPVLMKILEHLVEHARKNPPQTDIVSIFLGDRPSGAMIDAVGKARLPLSIVGFGRLKAAGLYVEPLAGNVSEFEEVRLPNRWENEASTEEMEKRLLDPYIKEREATRCMKTLLNAYCKERDLDKVEEILEKLPESELTGANLSFLVELFVHLKDSERALKFLEAARQRQIHLNPFRILSVSELLVEEKRLPDAIAVLETESGTLTESIGSFNIDDSASSLLSAVYRNHGVRACLDFYEKNLLRFTDSRCLGHMVKELAADKLTDALEIFKEVAYKYRGAPYKKILAKRLIEENKTEELEAVISIISNVIGTIDCCHTMAIAYFECDKMDDAKAMLARCGGPRGRANIIQTCNNLMVDGQYEKLDSLLDLMEDACVEKDITLLYRIKQCNRTNDVKGAMELWTKAQEVNMVLLPVTLDILAKLLQRNDQPVPFVVPEVLASEHGDARFTKSRFLDILDKSVDEALEYRNQLKSENRRLANQELMALLNELVKEDRLNEAFEVVKDYEYLSQSDRRRSPIDKLLGAAATKGMLEELEAFHEFTNKVRGKNALQKAYFVTGRGDEYVTKLEKEKLEDINFYLTSDFLTKDPAVGARLEKLAHRLASELKDYVKVAQLWYLYILSSEVDRAADLLKTYPDLEKCLEVYRVPMLLKKSFNEALLRQICQLTENQNIRSKVLICAATELVNSQDIDELQKVLDYAESIGISTANLPRRVLVKAGRELPEWRSSPPEQKEVETSSG